MSNEKKIVSQEILDGVVITEYDDGSETFVPVKESKQIVVDNRSWWQKVKDWWTNAPIKPYVKIRDLADPFDDRAKDRDDIDVGSDGKSNVEIGVKISF